MCRSLFLVLLSAFTLHSAPLDKWVWRQPAFFNFQSHEVLFADGKFALVGEGSCAAISSDGRNWEVQPNDHAGVLSELYHANGRWFASGYVSPGVPGNVTVTSIDGLQYTQLNDDRFTGVVFTGGTFIAAASRGLYESTDGIAWRLAHTNDLDLISMVLTRDQTLVGLTFGGALLHSTTGANWTVQFNTSARFLSSHNGVLYAFGDNLLLASTDGLTWTPQPVITPPWVLGGLFSEKAWIIYGQTPALKPQFSHSFDQGKTWTLSDAPLNWRAFGIAYGNGIFVAVGTGVAISEDGLHWGDLAGARSGVDGPASNLAYGNGVYVASSGSQQSKLIWSTNAIHWSPAAVSATGAVYNITFGPAGFVAGGYPGMLLHSSDGRIWSDVSVEKYRHDLHSIHDLDVFDGKYYALARSVLLVSSDGRTWQDHPLPGVFSTHTKIGNRFVIVGPESGLRTSENLVDWAYVSTHSSPLAVYSVLDKAYVTTWDGHAVSTNGIAWTSSDPPPFRPVPGFNHGILAIRKDDSTPNPTYPFSYSRDGIHWQNLGGLGGLPISQTLYVNGRLFAVSSGAILEAPYFGFLQLDRGPDSELKMSLQSGGAASRFQSSTDLKTWTDTDLTPSSTIDPATPQSFFRARLDPK